MEDIKRIKPEDFDWDRFSKGKIAIEVDNRDPNELDEVLSIPDKKVTHGYFRREKLQTKIYTRIRVYVV